MFHNDDVLLANMFSKTYVCHIPLKKQHYIISHINIIINNNGIKGRERVIMMGDIISDQTNQV
eukprot:gnl/Chilomastix_caulleri/5070.p1 GENE.gnl/Chilomastix_caulleri/5070~~gnl/Chilomastix_caulleri/5070.p1  ORF type:complete len:63 (-),score=2.95 gnl/Chilomastix_caulleri/5070:4-192(-)